MLKAKVETVDGVQIIRFPPDLRINVPEVFLKRVDEGFLMMTRDPWEIFHEGVNELSDDFGERPREQPPLDPFPNEP